MEKRRFALLPLILLWTSLTAFAQDNIIKSNDPYIRYMGRVIMSSNAAQLSWPATIVKLNFTGSSIKADLKDEFGTNYYNVIVDGNIISKIKPDSIRKTYTLAENLPGGKHTLELFKRTEWAMGKTWFYQFILDDKGDALAPSAPAKKRIEVYGNSITCGYAVEDSSGQDRGTAPYENAYVSYASVAARHFNADYRLIAKSGIGILVSWFPLIMPEMYDRADATDPASKWDFTSYTPDLVIINLFQNDSWLVLKPEHEQFKTRFGNKAPDSIQITSAYKDFVSKIRSKYPKAQIICALGSMDATRSGSPWPGYIKKAIAELHDNNIHTLFFPFKNTSGHPNTAEQNVMAKRLISFIEKRIKW